jgi:hypothetical protein
MSEQASSSPEAPRDALVPLGYIFAVLVPFIGLVLGIIAATRSAGSATRRHGPWIIALATVTFAIWAAAIYAEVHHSDQAAAQQVEEHAQEAEQHTHEAQNEAENQTKEEAESQYCHEHPGAGEHMAGGYYYNHCAAMYEEGG